MQVFDFNSKASGRSPIGLVLKVTAPAVVALTLSFGAAASQASTYVVSGTIPAAFREVVSISGPPDYGSVYAGPMVWNGTVDGQPFTDLVAFCVDLYHHISLSPSGLTYYDNIPLTYDSNPGGVGALHPLLTTTQLSDIGRLVNFGTLVALDASATNKQRVLSATQGAIWEIAAGVNVFKSGDASYGNLVDAFKAGDFGAANTYGAIATNFTLLTPPGYPNASGAQSFAIAAAVPEPRAWALMIGGFGVAGAMLRRQSRRTARVRI